MPELCSMRFYCENCDYGTSKKSSYENHINSSKHKSATNSNKIMPKLCRQHICCNCGKTYKDRTGLWRHRKTCTDNSIDISINEDTKQLDKDELIIMLIKENTEFKSIIMEQQNMIMKVIENGTINNISLQPT